MTPKFSLYVPRAEIFATDLSSMDAYVYDSEISPTDLSSMDTYVYFDHFISWWKLS